MSRNSFFIIIISALFLLSFKGLDEDLLQLLKNKFQKYVEIKSPDKIFIHTDRDLFYKGETIWFKGYITNNGSGKLHNANDILVVQLFNKDGNAVIEKKYKAISGVVKGQIELPDSLQGTYLMVAYNQWQLNFGNDYAFKKKITVEAFQETNDDQGKDTLNYDLQFFPEGGDLVENIESRIGFKATSSLGSGADVFGYLIKNGSDTLLNFSSGHAGIGSFVFTPEAGSTYKAAVEALNIYKEFSLPDAEQQGVVLTVINNDEATLTCKINRSEDFVGKTLIIGLFQNGIRSPILLKEVFGKESIMFSKEGLIPGVATLTVFDELFNPLAERIIFVNNKLDAELDIKVSSNNVKPREKAEALITLSDKDGKPVSGSLSASIYPARFIRSNSQPNIVEYLLLSSEVKGEIENPDFYFKDQASSQKALDVLLLVQGWRKYNWKEIKNDNLRLKFAREDKIILKGRVYQSRNNQPFSDNSITASVGGVDPYYQYIVLDDNGRFSIDASEIPDGQLFFQSTAPYEYGIKVELEKNTINALENIDLTTSLDYNRENELRKVFAIYNSYDLLKRKQEVVAPDKKKINAPYDMVVDLDEYVNFYDMAEVFKEIVPGVKIRKKKDVYDIRLLNMDKKLYYKFQPLYIIDGIPVYDNQIIMNMDFSDVKLIEVIRSKDRLSKYGHLGMGGALQIRTRTGSFIPPNIEGIASFDYKGVEKPKEFFNPKYKSNSKPDNVPDFRNTILWNPDLNVGNTGKVELEFYYSDELEDLVIEVQGITSEGIPVYSRKTIPGIRL